MYIQINVSQLKQISTLSQINVQLQQRYTYKIQHSYNDQCPLYVQNISTRLVRSSRNIITTTSK